MWPPADGGDAPDSARELGGTDPPVADDSAARVPRLKLDVIGARERRIRDVVGLGAPERLGKFLNPF